MTDTDANANDIRDMLATTAQRLFTGHVDQKVLDAAKRDGWSPTLWEELEKAELPRVGIAEARGGAGGTLSDAAAVLHIAARHAAPVPLAETYLAGWLLASAGLDMPRGALTIASDAAITVAKAGSALRVTGTLKRVPYARAARQLVLVHNGWVMAIDTAQCRIKPGRNLASEARDEVALDNVTALAAAPTPVTADALLARGAVLRALQIAGALERALDIACEYARTRAQFGRKIAQFQAIQQEIARCGGEVAAAVAAALSAVGVLERLEGATGIDADQQSLLAVASAKIRAADAAREAAAITHQVHGAIGVTDEYALHYYTLRALAWRDEFGNDVYWATTLGRALQHAGADAHWSILSAA